jgi:hypothetical protein
VPGGSRLAMKSQVSSSVSNQGSPVSMGLAPRRRRSSRPRLEVDNASSRLGESRAYASGVTPSASSKCANARRFTVGSSQAQAHRNDRAPCGMTGRYAAVPIRGMTHPCFGEMRRARRVLAAAHDLLRPAASASGTSGGPSSQVDGTLCPVAPSPWRDAGGNDRGGSHGRSTRRP